MKKSRLLGAVCACLLSAQLNASVIHEYDFSNAGNGGSDNGILKFSSEGELKPDGYINSNYGDFKGTINGTYYDFANLPSPGAGWSGPTEIYRYDFNAVIPIRVFVEFNKASERYTYDLKLYDFSEATGLGSGSVVLSIQHWNPSYFIENYSTGEVGYIHTTPPVPIPPALWLFGSGLLGLLGIARSKS